MLITTQTGRLRIYQNGGMAPQPALKLGDRVCTGGERGLLGVAVDPQFSSNRFIYLYYTRNESGTCINRVQRYTLSGGNVARSSKVLLRSLPLPASNHNGGDLNFGTDGYLYVTVGDGGTDYRGDSGSGGKNDASRDRNVVLGKVLRITRDGGIPETNPFTGQDTKRCAPDGRVARGLTCQETFAMGLRNPFRFTMDPNALSTRFFINDVGQKIWEEIDEGQAGADYGWNLCEGTHDNPDRSGSVANCSASPYTPPIHEYNHDTGCQSITGGAFVPSGASWPAEYDGSYLFGDFVCGKIFKLDPVSGGGYQRTEFVTGLGQRSAVHMEFGPYAGGQALYYTTYADGGEVRRISYS
jgi:glucose/arabinose dehydrogenase